MKDHEMKIRVENLLNKCQGKLMFKLNKRITQGEALEYIFEQFAKNNGFDYSKADNIKDLVVSDSEELEYIETLLKKYEKTGEPQISRQLQEYLERMGIIYNFRNEFFKEDLIAKIKEVFDL